MQCSLKEISLLTCSPLQAPPPTRNAAVQRYIDYRNASVPAERSVHRPAQMTLRDVLDYRPDLRRRLDDNRADGGDYTIEAITQEIARHKAVQRRLESAARRNFPLYNVTAPGSSSADWHQVDKTMSYNPGVLVGSWHENRSRKHYHQRVAQQLCQRHSSGR